MLGLNQFDLKSKVKSKLSEAIFITLRDRIVYLDYPQNFLLTEKQLCKEFGVSRTPLREAIFKLESMNLVKSVPRFGTFVTPINVKEIRDTYLVKANLESLAGKTAAERITPSDAARLENITEVLNKVAMEGNIRQMFDCDFKFHEIIWKAAENLVLFEFLENIHARCLRFCIASAPKESWGIDNASEVKEICDAIVGKKKEKAAKLLSAHNMQFLALIKENFSQSFED